MASRQRTVFLFRSLFCHNLAQRDPEPTCKAKVDVGFVLDSSGSLKNDYDNEKHFLKALAATFGVSDDGARAGVVTFSYYTEHSIKLNDHTKLSTFNDAVDKIALMGSTTRIDKALRMVQSEMFSIPNGGRPGVNKVLILLTDGTQTQDNDAEDPAVVAKELRDRGIRVISIGIGKGVNPTELAGISGDQSNVFSADSFDQLVSSDFLGKVNEAGCKEGMFLIDIATEQLLGVLRKISNLPASFNKSSLTQQ